MISEAFASLLGLLSVEVTGVSWFSKCFESLR